MIPPKAPCDESPSGLLLSSSGSRPCARPAGSSSKARHTGRGEQEGIGFSLECHVAWYWGIVRYAAVPTRYPPLLNLQSHYLIRPW